MLVMNTVNILLNTTARKPNLRNDTENVLFNNNNNAFDVSMFITCIWHCIECLYDFPPHTIDNMYIVSV